MTTSTHDVVVTCAHLFFRLELERIARDVTDDEDETDGGSE